MANNFFENIEKDFYHSIIDYIKKKKSNRVVYISYSPAFRIWMQNLQTNLSENYVIFRLEDLLADNFQFEQRPRSITKDIFLKIFQFLGGILPGIGIAFSGVNTVIEIANTTYQYCLTNSEIRILKDKLGLRVHKKKRKRELKRILFIPDFNQLSVTQQNYINLIEYLIQNNYISTVMLIVCQYQNEIKPINNAYVKELYLTVDMLNTFLGEKKKNAGLVEILNIVGIQYLNDLIKIFSSPSFNGHLVHSLIDLLLEKNLNEGQVNKDEFHRFLKLCSLLFEPFLQEDIEQNYKQENISADKLVEYALKSRLLYKEDYTLSYYFIEYFIRDFYRNVSEYTFSVQTYKNLFNYLKEKYPYQYTDIAILSKYIGLTNFQSVSYGIIAWYHEAQTIPKRKLNQLCNIINSNEVGEMYLKLQHIYCRLDTELDSFTLDLCKDSLTLIDNKELFLEAKCCYLNIIVTILFEINQESNASIFQHILQIYLDIFQKLKIFSKFNPRYSEYIADALLLSVDTQLPNKYKNSLERIASLLSKNINNLPKAKMLKLCRLGNVIFSSSQGHKYTQKAYNESSNYPYENVLSAINYSASLLSKNNFDIAYNVLNDTLDTFLGLNFNTNTTISYENNFIIAKYYCGRISKKEALRQFKKIYNIICEVKFSDSIIVQNNYAAMNIINCSQETLAKAEEILKEIILNKDNYHRFFAVHNLLVLSCLSQNKEKFLYYKEFFEVPYLLRKYEELFIRKIDLLYQNFNKCNTLYNISNILSILKEQFPEYQSSFHILPVLFGVIERWFE